MNSKIPPYLYEKGNIVRLILFTALFALLFINIFQPFGSRGWYPEISDTKYFVFSSLIILTGMLVVVVSRMIMHRYTRQHSISYVQFALWILCEILAMSLFFSLFTKFIPSQGAEREFTEIFRSCTINTGLILLLPYSISWLYFSWKEKNRIIGKLKAEESAAEVHTRPMVAFTDEKGELKFSLMVENLLYIDSADNYATIHYLNKSKLSHYLLRNTLKWVDENLTKETLSCDGIENHVQALLNDIQENIYKKAFDFRISQTREVNSYNEFKEEIEKGGFLLCHWDGTPETEERIKDETKATIRCIPIEGDKTPGVCMVTGKPSAQRVIFARAY